MLYNRGEGIFLESRRKMELQSHWLGWLYISVWWSDNLNISWPGHCQLPGEMLAHDISSVSSYLGWYHERKCQGQPRPGEPSALLITTGRREEAGGRLLVTSHLGSSYLLSLLSFPSVRWYLRKLLCSLYRLSLPLPHSLTTVSVRISRKW